MRLAMERNETCCYTWKAYLLRKGEYNSGCQQLPVQESYEGHPILFAALSLPG